VAGPAVPVRHFGSVDVFLEALESAPRGGVLVIDNDGREDEACIGDLTVAEVQAAGLAAIVLWGLHRDGAILSTLRLPVWSLGACPPGPLGARPVEGDPFAAARVGDVLVARSDLVIADDDGVVFVDADLWPDVRAAAAGIVEIEGRQAAAIAAGTSLREQLRFRAYLQRRTRDPDYGFRQHLAEIGGAIET
jgi:regulator of RNase E activity RraA